VRRGSLILTALGALFIVAEPLSAQQGPTKIPRVGVLSPAGSPSTKAFDAFRNGLREFGYIEGSNIKIEYRLADWDYGRLPAMAADLVRLPVDVIATDGGPRVVSIAQEATHTIPIVAATAGADPVAAGLAASLAHPGGNVTGFSAFGVELSTQAAADPERGFPCDLACGGIAEPAGPKSIRRATEEAAGAVGVELSTIEVATPGQIPSGFETAVADGANALVVLPDAMFWNERGQIVALAAKHRVPAIYPEREYVEEGGLLAYGSNVPDQWRRRATYVDKILKGAKPGDLPIQQPVKFDFIINLKAARALDLTIPPAILDLADEVIE
jgi:putative ABC transport system substrate-binding protein